MRRDPKGWLSLAGLAYMAPVPEDIKRRIGRVWSERAWRGWFGIR